MYHITTSSVHYHLLVARHAAYDGSLLQGRAFKTTLLVYNIMLRDGIG